MWRVGTAMIVLEGFSFLRDLIAAIMVKLVAIISSTITKIITRIKIKMETYTLSITLTLATITTLA